MTPSLSSALKKLPRKKSWKNSEKERVHYVQLRSCIRMFLLQSPRLSLSARQIVLSSLLDRLYQLTRPI